MIDLIQSELAKGTYSSDPNIALTELQNLVVTTQGNLDAGKKIKLAALAPNIKPKLQASLSNTTAISVGSLSTTVSAICEAALLNISSDVVDLRFDDPQTDLMLTALEAVGVLTSVDVAMIKAVCTTEDKPLSNATLWQVKKALGNTNTQSVTWSGGKFLVILVTAIESTNFNALITFSNDLFTDELLGRTVPIKGVGKYIVDLTGLNYKIVGNTTITVDLVVDATFTIGIV